MIDFVVVGERIMQDRVFLDQYGEPLFTLTFAPRRQANAEAPLVAEPFTPRPQLGFGAPGADRSWTPPTAQKKA